MALIDDVIVAIDAQKPREQLLYRAIAKQLGVSRATLARRHQGVTESRAAAAQHRQLLNP
jgi:AraC-like DNA-binding protein